MKLYDVKITAIRKVQHTDLSELYENPHSAMISCNDGFRPVSFLLERCDV